MAKTRRKNKSELEHLRGLNREYEKEIRSLQRALRNYEKWDRSQEESIPGDSEDTYPETTLKRTKDCPVCEKDKMIETLEIRNVAYGECSCGHKGRIN